jgi:hypothetical protein
MTEDINRALAIPEEKRTGSPAASPGCPQSVKVLRFFAWLDLVGGVVGGVWILSVPGAIGPGALGLGIAVLAQGAFVWALLLVIASIGEDVAAIRWFARQNQR